MRQKTIIRYKDFYPGLYLCSKDLFPSPHLCNKTYSVFTN